MEKYVDEKKPIPDTTSIIVGKMHGNLNGLRSRMEELGLYLIGSESMKPNPNLNEAPGCLYDDLSNMNADLFDMVLLMDAILDKIS